MMQTYACRVTALCQRLKIISDTSQNNLVRSTLPKSQIGKALAYAYATTACPNYSLLGIFSPVTYR